MDELLILLSGTGILVTHPRYSVKGWCENKNVVDPESERWTASEESKIQRKELVMPEPHVIYLNRLEMLCEV